ncbi:MAG: hypothetical protein OEM98_15105 [Gammaproteobacteria bacterium]|nr:hypothetical protein [Gammaproteobacteria bacterium]
MTDRPSRIRRLMDWCLGDTAMRRSRPHPVQLRPGDVLDGWGIIGLTPSRRLTLRMGMRRALSQQSARLPRYLSERLLQLAGA